MLKRYLRWRYRLRVTTHDVAGTPVRLTYQRGRLVGVEFWSHNGGNDYAPAWGHTIVKGHIDPRGQI